MVFRYTGFSTARSAAEPIGSTPLLGAWCEAPPQTAQPLKGADRPSFGRLGRIRVRAG